MAKVTKTEAGTWQVRISLTDPLTGRRLQKRISARTRRLLDLEVARIRSEWASGSWIEPDKTTVLQWLTTWHSTYRASGASRYARGGHIRNHIANDDIGRMPLVRLRYAHVQDWVDRMVMAGLAPATIRSVVSTLSVALTQAVRRQMIAANPCDELVLPQASQKRWRILDERQARSLVEDTRDDPLHAAWVLLITIGIRRGELLALDWADVDLVAGTLRIERTITISDQGVRIMGDAAKTESGRRVIRLPVVCLDALRRHRARQNERRLAAGDVWVDSGALFDSGLGERLGSNALYDAFRDVKTQLGLPADLRQHDLRHSAASLLILAGVPIPAISKILGHSNPAMTLSIYSHALRSMEDHASERIDRLFRGDDERPAREG